MDLSIITSLYKSEKFLYKYVKRIESFNKRIAKYKISIEFIVVANDISSIEEELLSKCRLSNLKIIKVHRETLYSSWNRGVKEAAGEVITFWNVDDIRFPGALFHGIKKIQGGAELIYFSFYIIGFSKITVFKKRITFKFITFRKVRTVAFKKDMFLQGFYGGPFFIFHRSVTDEIGYFDSTFTIAGDFDWLARAAFNNIKIEGDNHTAGIFFVHANNISGTNHEIHVKENDRVHERYSKLS